MPSPPASGTRTDKAPIARSDGLNEDWAYPAVAAMTPHRVRFTSGEARYAA
jgi:hypothetical protein